MQENKGLLLDFLGGETKKPESKNPLKYLDMTRWANELAYAYSRPLKKAKEIKAQIWKEYQLDLNDYRYFQIGANGDFHHLSHLLLSSLDLNTDIHLIVFDNHPDNMIYPFGLHCGSWVYHAAKLPQVKHVSVIGITSEDLNGFNILQNHYSVMRSGKVHYYPFKQVGKLIQSLSQHKIHPFPLDERNEWTKLVKKIAEEAKYPIYLSIDKDVCTKEDLPTNWDQGILKSSELLQMVSTLRPHLVAMDVVGGMSSVPASTPLKKILRYLDGESLESPSVDQSKLHQDFDEKLFNIWRQQ